MVRNRIYNTSSFFRLPRGLDINDITRQHACGSIESIHPDPPGCRRPWNRYRRHQVEVLEKQYVSCDQALLAPIHWKNHDENYFLEEQFLQPHSKGAINVRW